MKKLNYLARIISVLMAALIVLTGCTSKKLEYYYPFVFFGEANLDEKDPYVELSSETSLEQKEMVLRVFQELCEKYQIKKKSPNVRTLTKGALSAISGSDSYIVYGVYGGEETVYLCEGVSEKDIPVICHELCHYLNGDGISYLIGEKYVAGKILNEGFTNYFSIKLYPHPENTSIYEFETFVASQFAVIVGEDILKDIYFNREVEILRDDFNSCLEGIYPNEEYNGIQSTPFDTMCATLEMYNLYLRSVNYEPKCQFWAMTAADCVEEMILNYAMQKGKKDDCQELLRQFLKAEDAIAWTALSNLDEMD